jgi:N-acetylglucosaminyl-diphospho-decaprenol L-rhamnosyltransferase
VRVGAVVLHYRYWPGINETLDALDRQTHPLEHVVVVDNASDDGSAEELKRRPGIELVEATANRGYAAGMNLGMDALRGRPVDALLLLTHEATLDPAGLSRLVDHLTTDPQVGAVGPLLAWRGRADTVYSAGVTIDPRTWYQHHVGAEEPLHLWTDRMPHRVDSLDGAAVLIRREAAETTGAINEDYFLYFEEVDYFVRMRRAGWAVACVPGALAVQQPGRHPQALWVRNSLKFLAANAPRRVLARELTRNGYHAIRECLSGQGSTARERLTGVAAFATRRPTDSLRGRP